MEYFFDTYALAEMILGSENYKKYGDSIINTSTLNMAEVYYFLLRIYDKKTADFWMKKLNLKLINIINLDFCLEASKFKFENKKEKLSYIDCLGYVISKTLNMKFLTGDEKFENKTNVEFVK